MTALETYTLNDWLRLMAQKIVDGASGAPGATSTAKTEDTAAGSGDVGLFLLAVRNDDAATVPAGANGRYSQVSVDNKGSVFTRYEPAATPTVTAPALSAATSGAILATNGSRRIATIFNNSGADLYVKLGTAASATSFTTIIPTKGYYEVPTPYTGVIHGFATLAVLTGGILVTEVAA